jgi:hypothetical protein
MKFYSYINDIVNKIDELSMKVPKDLEIQWDDDRSWDKTKYITATIGETKILITWDTTKTKGRYKIDFGIRDRGKAKPLDIFMAVMEVIKRGIKKGMAKEIWLMPADLKRSNIYKRMMDKFLPSGWKVETTDHPFETGAKIFLLKKEK